MIRTIRIWYYSRKLAKLLEKNRLKSQSYAKHRKAALRHEPKVWA